MNGLRYKFKKCISLILPIFLLGSISPEPFFTKKVNAAEIGMVGALPGSVTLWEIFQTIWAGAGIIIANEEIQNSAASNFGSSSYTLSEMQSMGFIPIGIDGSNALDWDWSGLEDELENSTSEDAKIIRGVFSQNGGSGQGGNNEDPWYKKAVNWVKSAVQNGYIQASQYISGNSGQIELTLGSISTMLGAAFSGNVYNGTSLDDYDSISPISASTFGYAYWFSAPSSTGGELPLKTRTLDIVSYSGSMDKIFIAVFERGSGTNVNHGVVTIGNDAVIVNNSDYPCTYTYTTQTGNTHSNMTVNPHSKQNVTGWYNYGDTVLGTVTLGARYGSVFRCADTDERDDIAINLLNPSITYNPNSSPDIITPGGKAIVPNGGNSWVPTPYIDSDEHLEIIPQPNINEFTQYVTENNPENVPDGEAWINTVDPFVSTNPTPAPTTRPQPTVNPNVSPIPNGEPGSEDNPIFTADPDPMPDIEDGFGTTFDMMDYFPFCIPSDLVAAFKIFEVSDDYRQAPYIDWNLKIDRFGIDEHIILDFSTFDSAAALFRILIFISFCISLIVLTKTLIWS